MDAPPVQQSTNVDTLPLATGTDAHEKYQPINGRNKRSANRQQWPMKNTHHHQEHQSKHHHSDRVNWKQTTGCQKKRVLNHTGTQQHANFKQQTSHKTTNNQVGGAITHRATWRSALTSKDKERRDCGTRRRKQRSPKWTRSHKPTDYHKQTANYKTSSKKLV